MIGRCKEGQRSDGGRCRSGDQRGFFDEGFDERRAEADNSSTQLIDGIKGELHRETDRHINRLTDRKTGKSSTQLIVGIKDELHRETHRETTD